MEHEIDLKNKIIYTDLVVEGFENSLDDTFSKIDRDCKITTIVVDEILEKELNKKQGTYITIEFDDVTDIDNRDKVGSVLRDNIRELMKIENISKEDSCLVIGLGNRNSTPDSLGALVLDNVLITRHLFLLDKLKDGIRNVSGFMPNVMANTGMESYDIIKGIILMTKPKFIIVIDSLRASSIERLNRTIQLTNTGISPGSGIGNNRMEISKNTLGIPVIAIGVPTVVDASTIVTDTLTYLFKHLSYLKNNANLNKLIVKRSNYAEKIKNYDLTNDEKEGLLGIIGSLSEEEKYKLIKEVLEGLDYDLIVTPKDIDFVISKLGEVIGFAINEAVSEEVDNY